MKAIYVVLGLAAVGGAIWWYKNKNAGATTPALDPAAATGVISMPASQAEATKIINLPDTLLQNTSGNTGIMPPVVTGAAANKVSSAIPTTQAPQITAKPVKVVSKASTILPSKLTALRGFGDPFILN